MALAFQNLKRACLSGKDLADLLEGKVIQAYGQEFAYDGVDYIKVWMAAETLRRRLDGDRPPPAIDAKPRK